MVAKGTYMESPTIQPASQGRIDFGQSLWRAASLTRIAPRIGDKFLKQLSSRKRIAIETRKPVGKSGNLPYWLVSSH